jgi:hydroxyacylglutathione hydrolase
MENTKTTKPYISAEDLNDKLKHDGLRLTIVSVFSKEEYDKCHIKGSINAPLVHLKTIAEGWDKKREIVVYCENKECTTSEKAYEILKSMGFEKTKIYKGGMKEWQEKGFNIRGTEC